MIGTKISGGDEKDDGNDDADEEEEEVMVVEEEGEEMVVDVRELKTSVKGSWKLTLSDSSLTN